ncbi:hypothetical protein M501DRAFT_1027162 [Patellaria atrata CBS 101060]|uniref:Hemerythrin-like domain-containing protein n=1 Tax=Patellaria atrata CBS 101060 TaxID=1346257 RepID=A0A9P4S1W5_9PEZI|nr:hypothetical protein M501DRAFT_1027162 [Patellaria atrata CBS 101060]
MSTTITETTSYTPTAAPARYSWEKGPWKLLQTPQYQTGATDQYSIAATTMVLVHNAIIRGFNSIYQQAPLIASRDHADFIGYAACWASVLHGHHTGEEEIAFPMIEAQLERPGLMAPNVAQHDAFHAGLDKYVAYLADTKKSPATFSGARLVAIMDEFRDVLIRHLNEEIPTLLDLARYRSAKLDLLQILDKDGEDTMGKMSKVSELPFFLLNHDVTFEDGLHAEFPPAPKVAKWGMMKIGTWVYRGWWKFATCDTDGRPREVAYVAKN